MTEQLVLTAIGADRPGIVKDLSDIIFKLSLNIEDSRMSILGGEFAILLLVSGESADIDSLQSQLDELGSGLGLNIMAKTTTVRQSDAQTVPYSVDVSSLDHQGIVHSIAAFFSSRNINIVDLETERYAAPHTGSPMFALHMTIGIDADTSISRLREDFYKLCDELNLDAELSNL
jgi:glycine cleavage system transcriptional repressor